MRGRSETAAISSAQPTGAGSCGHSQCSWRKCDCASKNARESAITSASMVIDTEKDISPIDCEKPRHGVMKRLRKESWKLYCERSNALTGAGSTLLRANPEAEVFGWCQERVETAQSSSMKASRQWKRRYLRKSTTKGFISGSKHLSAKAQCAKPLHIWQQQ